MSRYSPEFRPPFWLPEGQSQTIIGAKLARYPRIAFTRQRIDTHDGDFIDLDWNIPNMHDFPGQIDSSAKSKRPLNAPPAPNSINIQSAEPVPSFTGNALVLFHGLEGSSQSHYAQLICHDFRAQGWAVVVAHFRGCSGEANRLPRCYFSGDTQDVATVMQAIQQRLPQAHWYATGISMGGNVLLKYIAENHDNFLQAVASISAPTDLVSTGLALGNSFFGRHVYTPYFLNTMKPKMREKATRFPGQINIAAIEAAKTLKAFDDAYTGPIHGFRDAIDYWTRCSAKPLLKNIVTPTLILNAQNDPFVPAHTLPTEADISNAVLLHQPKHGGHVGFSQGTFPHHLGWLSQRLWNFFTLGH
ncbi:YheT family hydrolase [Pelistega europaea]|uniref:Alpha/beta fold hydrolase n=1 Tax=Pelistega europaea TaxID=106147 RepID=A0A7Y4P4Q9_9BURK|nr:alpha/beta fold hydrolase [Pelistega europaea]NOL49756.1 alpha/beta fold hydrolase [Pelistega europaea]